MGTAIARLAVVFALSSIAVLPCVATADAQLDPKIKPADREKYKEVRDAKDWANPYLVVRADGIEVRSKSLAKGRKMVPVKELQKTLVALPVDAWPYGKVAAVQAISIRSGNDDALIESNLTEVEKILKVLQITIDWWPS
jgi:hypothetical protein